MFVSLFCLSSFVFSVFKLICNDSEIEVHQYYKVGKATNAEVEAITNEEGQKNTNVKIVEKGDSYC